MVRLASITAISLLWGEAALAQQAEGERLFKQRCAVCHQIEPGKTRPTGPNLHGVIGRPVAGSAEFKTYSPGLKKIDQRWTAEEMDKFLAAPNRYAPGTRMVIAVPDKTQRGFIVAYLASLGK